jgi:murein DD-endopeptidase MepM/ murein hydrolase activator NlpD
MTGIRQATKPNHFFRWFSSLWSRAFHAPSRRTARIVAVLFGICALAACAHNPHRSYYGPAPGSYHVVTVKPGDTLSGIALRYRVSEDDVAAMNRLRNRDALRVGQVIRVPAYGRVRGTATVRMQTPPRPATSRKPATSKPTQVAYKPTPKPTVRPRQSTGSGTTTQSPPATLPDNPNAEFVWPLDGVILSSFGSRHNGERNDGINIACTGGEAIRAAADGTVTYVGNELKGYGNLILIKHDNGFTSAYAHADEIKVTKGSRVSRGQVIAYAGSTGDVAEPQLHFELRRGTKPVDPRPYLRTYGS